MAFVAHRTNTLLSVVAQGSLFATSKFLFLDLLYSQFHSEILTSAFLILQLSF
jgi:hypothetical protein